MDLNIANPVPLGVVAQSEAPTPTNWLTLVGTTVADREGVVFHTLKKSGEKLLNSKNTPYGYFSMVTSKGLVTIFCHNPKMYTWGNGLQSNSTVAIRCPSPTSKTELVNGKQITSMFTTGVDFLTRELVEARNSRKLEREALEQMLTNPARSGGNQPSAKKGLIRTIWSKIW